VPHGR
jgi:hypothetical protein